MEGGEASVAVELDSMDIEQAVEVINLAVTAGVMKRKVLKRSPTHCSLRVLATKIGEMERSNVPEGAKFFMEEEERARSESPSGSMPGLQSMSDSSDCDL